MGLVELYEKERLRIAETADGRGDYSHPVFGEARRPEETRQSRGGRL